MQDAAAETLCARLCLLTRAVWTNDLPPPMTRAQVRRLYESGALAGLVVRDVDTVHEALLGRARELLTRNSEIYALLRSLRLRGYRTLLPEDRNWPAPLLSLGKRAPLFLFARGNQALLGGRLVAVAGSRDIGDGTRAEARQLGRRLAEEGLTLVSGAARGVDIAAQAGVLEAGGCAVIVPANPCRKVLANDKAHAALGDGRLLLLSETLPDEPFSAWKALSRNHIIYALGGATLVLAAREGVGGSWRGATDCLKGGYSPVFVPEEYNPDSEGCRALLTLGARTFSLSAPLLTEQIFPGLAERGRGSK